LSVVGIFMFALWFLILEKISEVLNLNVNHITILLFVFIFLFLLFSVTIFIDRIYRKSFHG